MILVSACLLGCACRYDGQSKPNPLAQELVRRGLAVPVCPEQLARFCVCTLLLDFRSSCSRH